VEVLRTPDARFAGLPGWSYAPRYVCVPDGEGGTLRMHHVDEGPRDAAPVLCLHGQPTWSYLYRKMIPLFVAAGRRVLAPDLVGFGRSEKPTLPSDYTYARHVGWLRAWLESLDLRDVTLVCQDWGGLVGLRVLSEVPERFARVVVSNTGLPDATGIPDSAAPGLHALYASLPVVTVGELPERFRGGPGAPPGFLFWRKFCAETPELRVGELMAVVSGGRLPPGVVAAYEAPFPDQRYVAGARRFPSLVPIFPDDPAVADNRRAWEVLRRFERPFLTAFTDEDPVTRGGEKRFQEEVPGARGQPHVTIRGAGHFVQEDAGEELARITLDFIARGPR